MTTLISIDRTSLSLSALTMSDMPPATSGWWVDSRGFGRPEHTKRRTYASDAPWTKGKVLTASVADQSTLPFTFWGMAASTSALYALMDALEAALDQFTYTVTVTDNALARTWTCDPADVRWSDMSLAQSRAMIVMGTVTIPVYPVAS